MTLSEKIEKVISDAADAEMNLHSEIARAVLVEKIMIEIGYHKLEEQNNG